MKTYRTLFVLILCAFLRYKHSSCFRSLTILILNKEFNNRLEASEGQELARYIWIHLGHLTERLESAQPALECSAISLEAFTPVAGAQLPKPFGAIDKISYFGIHKVQYILQNFYFLLLQTRSTTETRHNAVKFQCYVENNLAFYYFTKIQLFF